MTLVANQRGKIQSRDETIDKLKLAARSNNVPGASSGSFSLWNSWRSISSIIVVISRLLVAPTSKKIAAITGPYCLPRRHTHTRTIDVSI